ncbi:MAG TPA: DUF444 family protein [Spirochaetia bacterium]|nr:DUF444 family protein [Spirochaetia bacterium]
MAVVQPDYDTSPRGNTDAARHRQKIKEAIRQNLPDIISSESIITRRGTQIVRIPVRGVKSYHFMHNHGGDGAGGGFGSGEGQRGKVVGQRPKPGAGQPGKPGGEPGVDYLETEIDIEELIEMMLEDLGLPNLQQKEVHEVATSEGWTYDSIEKSGIRPRIDKKRSIKEAIKRTEGYVSFLMQESGRSEEDCRRALIDAGGDLSDARRILEEKRELLSEAGDAVPVLESSDLRYRTLTEEIRHESNAVVIAMMDVSGSMDTMKKYFARSFFFWMVSFLRTIYKRVEIRFISHTTEAKLVDEEEFFHKGESGGTQCYTAYDLATEVIDGEYPTSRWNVYPFHFSDGEDWDAERTVQSLKQLLSRNVAAFGYGEIQTEYSASVLMQAFEKELDLAEGTTNGCTYYEGRWNQTLLTGMIIRSRQDLYPALKVFLSAELP